MAHGAGDDDEVAAGGAGHLGPERVPQLVRGGDHAELVEVAADDVADGVGLDRARRNGTRSPDRGTPIPSSKPYQGWMQRDDPILAAFAVTDDEQALMHADVGGVEAGDLMVAEPGEQAKSTAATGSQRTDLEQRPDGVEADRAG